MIFPRFEQNLVSKFYFDLCLIQRPTRGQILLAGTSSGGSVM
jgi:hypothetical protein